MTHSANSVRLIEALLEFIDSKSPSRERSFFAKRVNI